jgi:hypothetical protein
LSPASFFSPLISKSTRAERPSGEIFGGLTFCTAATFEIRPTTSATAASNAGVPAFAEALWTSTLSSAGSLNPESRTRSIRPDSPGPAVFGSMFLTPTWPPIPKATTTSASQPNVAVFQ